MTDIGFRPGTVACDNKLAWRAHQAGYRVCNPSQSVRLYHLHAAATRSQLDRLPAPYCYVWPHAISDVPRSEVIETYNGPAGPSWLRGAA